MAKKRLSQEYQKLQKRVQLPPPQQMLKLEELGVTLRETTLSNGCKVVLFERPKMPLAINIIFLSGSRFDKNGKEGTSHFLEHMIVAGSKKFPSKDKLAAYIEQYGGVFNASTSSDTMNIRVSIGDPSDMSKAFDVLHEILLDPFFEEKTLETERGSVLREIGQNKSSPQGLVSRMYYDLFFQGTEAGRVVAGSEDSVKLITKEDISNFYKDNLVSGRMAMSISGGVSLEDVAREAENKILLPQSTRLILEKDLPIVRGKPVMIAEDKNTDKVNLIFGFRTPRENHVDVPALRVITNIIGGGRASTLLTKLRYEKGLVYGISAGAYTLPDAGITYVQTSVLKEKLQETLDIITMELKRIVNDGLTNDEVSFAKNKIIKSKRMQMQTSESWAGFGSYTDITGPKIITLSDYVVEIEAVTQEDTKRVAGKYFTSNNWYLAMHGDVKENEIRINL